jgi:hypothetical protein
VVVSDTVTVDPREEQFLTAACDATEVVTGGGFGFTNGLDVLASQPDRFSARWKVVAFNPSDTSSKELTAFAVCVRTS